MRMKIVFACLVLLFTYIAPLPVSADDKADASAFIDNVGKQALGIISDKSKSKEQKNGELQQLFIANVDIDWIGKYVSGRYWRTASDAQKQQYMTNYKTFLVSHYTSNFAEYTNANFQVTRVMPADSGGDLVTMHIKRPQAEDIVVDYTIKKDSSGAFKVYDIIVEGVSMITTQRSDFSSYIGQNGFDALITQLAARSKSGS